jgi:hypothetical protein
LRRALALALLAAALPMTVADDDAGVELLLTDSRTPYVHRLTLYDHDGAAISPTDEPARPYSPRRTCGKCHPYATIGHGWHFNADDPTVPPGRPGEPWFLVDDATDTILPISGRGWPGTARPAEVGLSHWAFVKRFGHHLPGGGYGEPSDEVVDESDEWLRWGVSGKLEIDCMICHCADMQHDPAVAASQIEKENFRWIPTVALGLGVVRGEARNAPDEWTPDTPPNPDYPEQAGPTLIYDPTRFDPDDRVLFNITRRVPNERCTFCHTTRRVGDGAPESWHTDQDVHLAAGLMCVDCHRHGIGHMITRGYDGESAHPARASRTCRGCHLGDPDGATITTVLGGHLRAPHPLHRGLPPLHIAEMTCIACHSGPWPQPVAGQVQTALAHRLGLATRERTADDLPIMMAPVFAPDNAGRVAAQRMMWPRFWASSAPDSDTASPVGLDALQRAAANVEREADRRWSNPAIESLLAALSTENHAAMLVRDGWLFQRGDDGSLNPLSYADWLHSARAVAKVGQDATVYTSRSTMTAPYRWAIAHDVRPAAQSLGVRGCTDCHAADAPIDFGTTLVADPAAAYPPPALTMIDLRGEDATLRKLWAAGFVVRPVFKIVAFIAAGIVALVLLRFLADAWNIGVLGAPRAPTAPPPVGLTPPEHVAHTIAAVGVIVQVATAFGSELVFGEFGGWPLLIHMGGAGLLVCGLAIVALQWIRRCRLAGSASAPGPLDWPRRWVFGVALLCGLTLMATMLLAMLPVFGTDTQHALIELHEKAALAMLATMIIHTILSLRARRLRGLSQ